MSSESSDSLFDRIDDLVQRALEGEDVGSAFNDMPQHAQGEFIEMMQAHGVAWAAHLETNREPHSQVTVGSPQGSPVVAAFLDAYWRDRSESKEYNLGHYLKGFPDDVEGVARCYLALNSQGASSSTNNSENRGQIGSYSLGEVLGRGGQATVYIAQDEKLQRTVALKVFEGTTTLNTRALERFKREARAVSKLSHPNIGRIFEADVIDGSPIIAMELIEGESLAHVIAQAKSHNDAESGRDSRKEMENQIRLLQQVAEALAAAHEVGVIHRDLKPANIMIRKDGSPVLLDFGLAKIENDDAVGVTGTLDLLGTPAYIAPERLRNPSVVATRCEDIYSLGVTAFELMTGVRPFDAPTVEELYQRKIRGEATNLLSLCPNASKDLVVVIETAMELEPTCRYQDAAQLAADLGRILAHESVSVRPLSASVKAARWYRRNAVVATLALVIFLSLAVFSGVTLKKNDDINQLRQSAEDRGDQLAKSLDEVLELSDVKRVDDLIAEADRLWPISSEMVPRMRRWLKTAKEVSLRASRHQSAFAKLQKEQLPVTKEQLVLELPVVSKRLIAIEQRFADYQSGRSGLKEDQAKTALAVEQKLEAKRLESYHMSISAIEKSNYATPSDGWRAELIGRLSSQLKVLGNEKEGQIRSITERLAKAETIKEKSIDQHHEAWSLAIAELKKDSRFKGFDLSPVIGFVPLGTDPQSGLQEFLHLMSHAEPTIPARDDKGKLPKLTAKMGVIMVLLPGGAFQMGAETDPNAPGYDAMADHSEGPIHTVVLDPFLISKYELWQGAYVRMAGANPSAYLPGSRVLKTEAVDELHPVEFMTWYDARKYMGRFDMDLPTEAQWEFACRAGNSTIWSIGNNYKDAAGQFNIIDKQLKKLADSQIRDTIGHDDGWALHAPVDQYHPNAYGLYQMHGNVYEWCLDAYCTYTFPVRAGDGFRLGSINNNDTRMFRGGAYCFSVIQARTTARSGAEAASRNEMVGIRPVFLLPTQEEKK